MKTKDSDKTKADSMRNHIALLLAVLMLLAGCAGKSTEEANCPHVWEKANCVAPKTCRECGKTGGEPLGHMWVEAACDVPKSSLYGDSPAHLSAADQDLYFMFIGERSEG